MALSYRGAPHVKDNHRVYTSEISLIYDPAFQTFCEKCVKIGEIHHI